MSSPTEQQHNLKVAERAYVALNTDDLETLIDLCHEEVEVQVAPGQGIAAGTHTGRQAFKEWFESFEDYKAKVIDVVPIGGNHLVVMTKQMAKEKSGEAPVEIESGNMLGFRGGEIAALHLHPSREEAIKAAEQRESEAGQ